MAGWLTAPIQLHGSRMFMCMDMTEEDCEYYQYPWRFWYEADHVYALPTVAFFLCAIGIFVIGHVVSRTLSLRRVRGPPWWQRAVAAVRYLSYRGFHVKALGWNSAPLGVLLLALAGLTFFFCMDLIPQPYYWPSLDWGSSPPLATRSGWMALACMPFIFATASKANWITLLTGVPHEKLQVFHRWTAYAFFVLALIHTFPFIVFHIREHDMVEQVTTGLIFYWTGVVAIIFQAWLTFASFGPLRNLGYEFFKAAHFLSAAVFVLIFFWHCDYTLTSWDYFIATAAVYVPSLVYPWVRTFFEYGGRQKAQLFVEENGFTRITVPAKFDWVPGQHCFLRFPGFGLHAFTSHPFTICSLPSATSGEQSTATFFIRHRGGFTARLYDYAMKRPGVTTQVLVDGPYGGIDPERFYGSDRVLVIAGGSGAGWTLPFVEQFARLHSLLAKSSHEETAQESQDEKMAHERTEVPSQFVGPSSLRVVLATREPTTPTWFHKTLSELLSPYNVPSQPRLPLDVQVHLTSRAEDGMDVKRVISDESSGSVASSSSIDSPAKLKDRTGEPSQNTSTPLTESQDLGRPELSSLVQREATEAAEAGQSLSVFVCGPVSMQHDVRNAVARENLKILKHSTRAGGVYLHLEHFSWA